MELSGCSFCGAEHESMKCPRNMVCTPNLYGLEHCFHIVAVNESKPEFTELSEVCCWCGGERKKKHGNRLTFNTRHIPVDRRDVAQKG